ncbi:MAG: hypothetical protein EOM87_00915 [Clostridia bacterium]|nr:hypothetical protein [Clostridia bacterium]
MAKYKICPRCELNYILEAEEYCSVCLDEMKGIVDEIEFDDDFTKLCPHCGVAYISDDQDMCEGCKSSIEKLKSLHEDAECVWEDENTVSLEEMGEEEEVEEELVIDEELQEVLEDDLDEDALEDEDLQEVLEDDLDEDLEYEDLDDFVDDEGDETNGEV